MYIRHFLYISIILTILSFLLNHHLLTPAPSTGGLFGAPAPAPSTGGLFGAPGKYRIVGDKNNTIKKSLTFNMYSASRD